MDTVKNAADDAVIVDNAQKSFLENAWGAEDTTPPKQEPKTEPKEDENLKELGYESWDDAKREFAELKKLKENPTKSDVEFANEVSKSFFLAIAEGREDDVYEHLTKQRELRRIENLDVTKEREARELIKVNFALKYPDLTDDEIDDMFNEQYGKPEKPKNDGMMDEEEYDLSLREWEDRSKIIEKKIIRDAKIIKPDVVGMQQKVVLPDIGIAQKQPTQEELEEAEKQRGEFLKTVGETLDGFGGFKSSVKDKDVELFTVNYDLSKDEKDAIKGMMTDFANSGGDLNAMFAKRWLKDDTLDIGTVIRDLSVIVAGENALNKFANQGSNKRFEVYEKQKKNVDVGGVQGGQFEPPRSDMRSLQEMVWNDSF